MFIQLQQDYLGQKAGQKIDVADNVAKALLEQGVAIAVQDDPLPEAINKALSESIAKITGSIETTIDECLREFAKARTLSLKNQIPAIFGDGTGEPTRTFGQFLLAVRKGDRALLDEMGSKFAEWDSDEKALGTSTGTQGGFTVPIEFLPDLLQISSENSVVEPRATKIPLAATSVEIPALDVTTASSSGDTAHFGGLNARWTEESTATTEDEPRFTNVRLTAHELSGYTLVSNALLQDNAIGLEALLRQLFGRALGWHKDYAYLRGDGVGKPLGMLQADSLISVTRSAGSAFALTDAASMLARLLPGYDPSTTVWAVHPTVLAQLFQMNESGAGSDLMVIERGTDAPRMMLLGIPVQPTEKLPALNTVGDVLLLDCKHYLIGDRQDVEIAFSEHYKFVNNQGTWRFVARVDGQPWMRSVVTLSDASSTLSPFVALAAG